MPLSKPFDQINKDDLDELIAQADAEKKTLEYKREIRVDQPSDRKEFLFDVSSFANTLGGHIFFGIEEDQGVPIALHGLPKVNPDKLISKLENMCRAGIEPRISGLQMKAISLPSKGPVIVIRLPRSWGRPHMVKYRGTNKFYSRNSNGKYPMDVSEIRSAFLLSEAAGERIRQFRVDRISLIGADETPVALDPFPKIVLHLVPSSFPDFQFQIDLGQAKTLYMKSLGTMGLGRFRYNFDGWLGYDGEPKAFSYVQLFRSGTVETVDASSLSDFQGHRPKA